MGNYMSAEPPKTPWEILHREVIQLGEEFEVEWGDGEGATGKIPESYLRCPKNPNHSKMVRLSQFTLEDIPAPWRDPRTYNTIMKNSRLVVKVSCTYVSPDRPDNYCHSQDRGKYIPHCGSGLLINLDEVLHQPPIECPLKHCKKPRPHKVTPIFQVGTANHVVFNHSEAEEATLTFFYDSDTSDTVRGEVLGVSGSNKKGDYIFLRCVSHDLDLFKKIRDFPIISSPSPPLPRPQGREPLLVILSHPHGYYKHVSFGKWVGYRPLSFVDGSYQGDLYVEMCNNFKLSDWLREWESRCPTIRETGAYISEGWFMSREMFREMEQDVQNNPNITMGDLHGGGDWRDLFMSFMTYTAATCPGSSGAPVFLCYDNKDDGEVTFARVSIHFRHYPKRRTAQHTLNASGVVHLGRENSEPIKPYKKSLTLE